MKEINFADIFPKDWYQNPEESSFLLRIYTIVPVTIKQLEKKFSPLKKPFIEDGIPIWIEGASINAKGLNIFENNFIYSDPETGTIILPTVVGTKELPLSTYLIMGCPLKIDGKELGEDKTVSRLNRVEALLATYLGSNTVYKLVFEAFYPALGNEYQVVSDVYARIQQCDGPWMAEYNWRCVEDTFLQIESITNSDKKARIKRALEFFHSGKSARDIGRDEKFFFYWTAITVLCEGKGTADINARLQAIYGFSFKEVEEKLRWKDILKARNLFFKQGKSIHLHKDAERYLQLLFLDLLRHEIDLPQIKAALSQINKLDLDVLASKE